MKNSNHVLMLFMTLMLSFTACVTEDIKTPEQEINPELTVQQVRAQHATAIDQYQTEFPDAYVEFTTLEAMNAELVAAGLEPTSLEELEATEAEYLAAQEKLNDPAAGTTRCSGNLAVYFGDMNNSGALNNTDVTLAQQCILQGSTNCSAGISEAANFGYLSIVWQYNNSASLSTADLVTARRIILGLAPCM